MATDLIASLLEQAHNLTVMQNRQDWLLKGRANMDALRAFAKKQWKEATDMQSAYSAEGKALAAFSAELKADIETVNSQAKGLRLDVPQVKALYDQAVQDLQTRRSEYDQRTGLNNALRENVRRMMLPHPRAKGHKVFPQVALRYQDVKDFVRCPEEIERRHQRKIELKRFFDDWNDTVDGDADWMTDKVTAYFQGERARRTAKKMTLQRAIAEWHQIDLLIDECNTKFARAYTLLQDQYDREEEQRQVEAAALHVQWFAVDLVPTTLQLAAESPLVAERRVWHAHMELAKRIKASAGNTPLFIDLQRQADAVVREREIEQARIDEIETLLLELMEAPDKNTHKRKVAALMDKGVDETRLDEAARIGMKHWQALKRTLVIEHMDPAGEPIATQQFESLEQLHERATENVSKVVAVAQQVVADKWGFEDARDMERAERNKSRAANRRNRYQD